MTATRHLLLLTLLVLITAPMGVAATEEGAPTQASDSGAETKATTTPSAVKYLAALDEAGRNNALIELEAVNPGAVSFGLPNPADVAEIWNNGDHAKALLALRQLESAGFNFIPAITWKEPIESRQELYYIDVRIGDARTGAHTLDLDYDSQEGTIFAAIGWADDWTMNISTDGGVTWQETFAYGLRAELSMAVSGDRVWVAYSNTGNEDELRMRRFLTTTGGVDSAYFFETVATITPATVVDVALISNEPDFGTAVYVGIVASDNSVRTYWDDLNGTSFSDYSPTISNADDNIDFTFAPFSMQTSGYTAFLSYESTAGDIVVWRMSFLGTWDQVLTRPISGTNNYTSISAFKDTVMVVYESAFAEGTGIRYEVSYNYGIDWYYGVIYEPEAGDPVAHGGAVSLSGGNGSFATYHLEEGAVDRAFVRSRSGYASAPWNNPIPFSNSDTMSGTQTKIEWIGAPCVGSYGMLYLAADAIPYFDLTSARGYFCDGFESGGTSAWN